MKSIKEKTSRSRAQAGSQKLQQASVSAANTARITAKNKRTKTALPEGAETARVLIDAFPDAALLTDTKGVILFANEAFAKRMGRSVDELIGSSAYDLLTPDLQRARRKKVRDVIRAGEPARFEDRRGGMVLDNTLHPIKDAKGQVICIAAYSRDITKEKQTEQALLASAQNYRALFERNQGGVYRTTLDGRWVDCNDKFAHMLGYASAEELKAKPLQNIYFSPTDRNDFITRLQANGYVENQETQLKRRNGTPVLILENVALLAARDEQPITIQGTCVDITERKQAELALQQSEARYRALIESMAEGVWVIDAENRTTFTNPQMAKILGYTGDEMFGKSLFEFMDDEGKALAEINIERRKRGIIEQLDFKFKHKNGNDVWVFLSTNPVFNAAGQYAGAMAVMTDITERKQSEQKYQHILQTAIDGFWLVDTRGNLLDVNEAYCRVSGYAREELLQMNVAQVEGVQTPEEIGQRIGAIMKSGSGRFRTKHRRKDGSLMDMEVSVQYVNMQGGMFVSFLQDITERKQAEDALKRQEALLETFFSQSLDGFFFMMLDEPIEWNDSADKEKLLEYAFAHQRMTKINDAMLNQYGGTRDQFLSLTPNDLMLHDIPYGKNLWRSLFNDGRIIVKTNVQKLDGAPMWIEGEYVCLYDAQGRVTGHFGIQREITAQKKLADDLYIKDSAIASSCTGMAITDFSGAITYVNNAWLEMFGYDAMQQVIGTTPVDHVQNPVDAERVVQALALQGQWLGELMGKRRDGSSFTIQLAASMVQNADGQPIAMQGSFLDITARKQIEQDLHRNNQIIEIVFEHTHLMLAYMDPQFNFIRVNPAFANDDRRAPEEYVGRQHFDLYPNAENEAIFRQVVESGHVYTAMEKLLEYDLDGKTRVVYHDWTLTPVKDSNNKVTGLIITAQDVTDRKLAHDALRRSEALLSEAQRISHIGSWELDLKTNHLTWSDEIYRIFEIDPQNFDASYDAFLSAIHPADRELVNREYSVSVEKHSHYSIEHRLQMADGRVKYVHEEGETFYEGGKPIRSIGTVHDITERKQAEQKLNQTLERLDLATSAARLGVWDWDVLNNQLTWDDRMYELYGVHKEDFSGAYEAWVTGLHPDDAARTMNEVQQTLRGEKDFSTEFRIVLPDGTIKYINAFASVALNADGQPIRMIGVNLDATERKQAEKAVQEQARLLDLFFEYSPDLMAVLDKDYNFIRVTESYARAGARGVSEFIGKNHFEIYPSDFKAEADNVRRGKYIYSKTARPFIYADHPEWGTTYWDISFVPILDDRGEVELFLLTLKNVTERVKSAEALQASEDLLRRSQQVALMGSWRMNLVTKEIIWSEEVYRIFEKDSRTFSVSYESFLDAIHPDDRDSVNNTYWNAVDNHIRYDVTHRLMLPDGRIKYLLEQGDTFYDGGDNPIYTIGITQDITERKHSDLALQEYQETLTSLIDALPDSSLLVNHDGTILAINQTSARRIKQPANEVVGKKAYDILPPAVRDERLAALNEALHTGQLVHYEDEMFGRILDNYLNPILDANGKAYRVAIFSRDITDQRRAEQQIIASLHEKEILLKEIHHRVKNNLQIISSLLYLQSRKIEASELRTMFLESQNRVVSMALIHEKLYQSADLSRISFGEYALNLARSLFQSFGVVEAQVALAVEAGNLALDIHNAIPCGLILNEIVSNSLKYAFPNGRDGTLCISLTLSADNHFTLIVSDDGVGLPADFAERSINSLGARLIERLANQMDGEIELHSSDHGTSYHIRFPALNNGPQITTYKS